MTLAVILAPEHAHLLNASPSGLPFCPWIEPERPAQVIQCEHCCRWDCSVYDHWLEDRSDLPRALVLYTHGHESALSLLRVQAIAFQELFPTYARVRWLSGEAQLLDAHDDTLAEWPCPARPNGVPSAVWALAQVLLLRGIAVQLLLLEET